MKTAKAMKEPVAKFAAATLVRPGGGELEEEHRGKDHRGDEEPGVAYEHQQFCFGVGQ
ncbi:hypothetical protein [Oceanithermus sp.]